MGIQSIKLIETREERVLKLREKFLRQFMVRDGVGLSHLTNLVSI